MTLVAYYSSSSGNTKRLVGKIGFESLNIQDEEIINQDYILIVPSYCGGGEQGVVHPDIVRFLNIEQNRCRLKGVIGVGNTNFGKHYCRSAIAVAEKCKVPLLQKIEVFGTEDDVVEARQNIMKTLGDINAVRSL